MKKVLLGLAALLFATASAQPTELSFQHAMSGPLGEAVTAMVEKYNAEQSDVVVNEEFIGSYDQALQKILAQLAGGTSPDIAQLEVALVARVAESGSLLDLAPRLQGEYQDLYDDLWPVFREQIQREDGSIYALPFNNSNPVLYYNPELLAQAGVEPPRTYAEFPDVACQIREATGAHAVAFQGFPWVLEGTVWSNEGEIVGEDGLMLSEPNAREVVQTWTDMIREDCAAVGTSLDQMQQDFGAGQLAMVFGSVASYFFVDRAVDFDFGVAPLPYFDEPRAPVGGADLVIFNTIPEKRQEAAWDFLVWLTEPEQQFDWAQRTNYVPVVQSATELPAFQEFLANNPDRAVGIDQLEYSRPRPSLPGYPQATPEIVEALESIWLQNASVEETLDNLAQRTQRYFR